MWRINIRQHSRLALSVSMILTGCLLVSVMHQPPFKDFKIEGRMGDMNLRDCLIYLDNIVAFSSTFEEHLEKMEAVFWRLQINNLELKASKCEFFKRDCTYLGYVISEQGICTDPPKIETVCNWPVPRKVKEIRTFLEFTGYYRRFVKGYASIEHPFNDLLIGLSTNKNAKKGKKPKPRPS